MARDTKGKSKTDVTARDKSGRVTNRNCSHCGLRIMNDREMIVVMDEQRRNKSFYRRECYQRMLGNTQSVGIDGTHVCPLAK
jgi:hypothetical protein